MKKRGQKKKSYLHIFLKKAMPSLIAYVLLLAIALPIFCRSQQDAYVQSEIERMVQLIGDELVLAIIEERLPYELGRRTTEDVEALQQHIWLTDTETGEFVEDSEQKFYWMKTMNSSFYQVGRYLMLYCDDVTLREKLGKYEEAIQRKCYMTRTGDLKYSSFGEEQAKKYCIYYMHDAYFSEDSIYPGTVSVEVAEAKEDARGYFTGKNEETCKVIDKVTLTPENQTEYYHAEYIEGEDAQYLMAIGDCYTIEDFPLTDKAYRAENSDVTPLAFPYEDGDKSYAYTQFDGRYLNVYMELCYKTTDDKFNTLHFASRLDYWAVAGKYLCGLGILTGMMLLGVVALLAKDEYRTLLAFYRQNEYRKSLMNAMAHDLKTPLAAMSGYAENLKENVNTEKREYYAEAVLKNAGYMNDIIANNLKLSEFENMTELPREEEIDFVLLCEELMKKYESILNEKECKWNITGSYVMKGNREALSIAMENLVSNAVKYVNPEGIIEIIGGSQQFTIQNTTEDNITSSVNKLWEPFVKGDQSRSNQRGNGLGLAIVKNVLDLHELKSMITFDEQEKEKRFIVTVKK